MPIAFQRVVRTPSSERFLIQSDGVDAAACDLHFLANETVAGTVILFDNGPLAERKVEELLNQIDEQLLPQVSLSEHSLSFTVVRGAVVGNFQPNK